MVGVPGQPDARQVEWTLSGNPKISTFALPANAQFQWQHDVELHSGNVVSVFDDACCNISVDARARRPFGTAQRPDARPGAEARPDQAHRQLRHPVHPRQELQRGLPRQHAAAARRQRGARLGLAAVLLGGQQARASCCSTRCGRAPTSATARTSRSGSGSRSSRRAARFATIGAKATVYASWDGDTQVVSWRVLAGSSAKSLKAVASKAKTGFETTIPLTRRTRSTRCRRLAARATCWARRSRSRPKLVGRAARRVLSRPAPGGGRRREQAIARSRA